MAPSTAEWYAPRREYNGTNCALSGFAKKSGNFAGKSGNFAEKSGILTIKTLLVLFLTKYRLIKTGHTRRYTQINTGDAYRYTQINVIPR